MAADRVAAVRSVVEDLAVADLVVGDLDLDLVCGNGPRNEKRLFIKCVHVIL